MLGWFERSSRRRPFVLLNSVITPVAVCHAVWTSWGDRPWAGRSTTALNVLRASAGSQDFDAMAFSLAR